VKLRVQVQELVAQGEIEKLGALVAEEPRAIRHLVGCTYQTDEQIRAVACRAIGRASRHHPDLVQQVVRRLIWAMNDESGTNSLTAPEVVKAVAEESPELLLPLVPDLTRLAADEGLYERLAEVLRMLAEKYPGSVGRGIQGSLTKELKKISKKRKTHGFGP
jgi:hypothetical protein